MRALLDIVENLTSTVRFIFGIIALGFIVTGLMFTIGASYFVPKAVDSVGERAERIGEKAIIAAQEERRAADMAKDGWGYRPPSAASQRDRQRDHSRDSHKDGGWGY